MSTLHLVSIAIGGAFGAISRFIVSFTISQHAASTFPLGTLVVNVVGCALLGALYEAVQWIVIGPNVRAALAVGFLGSLTTFSTFTLETMNLLHDGEWGLVGLNVGASVVLGFIACLVGIWGVRAAVKLLGM